MYSSLPSEHIDCLKPEVVAWRLNWTLVVHYVVVQEAPTIPPAVHSTEETTALRPNVEHLSLIDRAVLGSVGKNGIFDLELP